MLKIKIKEFFKTNIKPKDYPSCVIGELIDKPCEVYGPNGELILKYIKAPYEIYKLGLKVALNTKPVKSARSSGVPQLSTVYGVLPRNAIREDYCRFSKKTKQEKQNYLDSLKLNYLISKLYKKILPENYNKAINKVRKLVNSEYRVIDTPWTTTNINLNQVIKYHVDKGNFKEDLSNVLIIKNGVAGGYLACPEIGVTLAQQNGYMVFFKGQEILHGVTPCNFLSKNSFRASIVQYTMESLKNCYPYELEIDRLKKIKTKQAKERKQKMLKLKKILNKKT